MEEKNILQNEYITSQDAFVLVQDKEKIFDVPFQTKPTTFIKDAFKRFCKNKSSVVGAIIIFIIVLLSLIVPTLIPYDIEKPHTSEGFLLPKVFESGTGFWDGTQRIKEYSFDEKTGLPYDYTNHKAVKDLVVYEGEDGVKLCDFTYDKYEAVYGEITTLVPNVTIKDYIRNGLCDFDFKDVDSFVIKDDSCPIRSVVSIETDSEGYTKVTCVLSRYRSLGYDEMPKFIFGTNESGHDTVKLSFIGLQKSLVFAIVIAAICFSVGLVWGAVSGYFGGNLDLFLERFKDILGGVPTVVIVTLFRLHLGDALWVFALSLCITGWMGTASRTRTQFYRFKGREYVLASRTLGASDKRLIFRHILPNSLGTIVTSSVLMIPSLIFTEATLSYLGLGLQGSDSFGTILSENQGNLKDFPALILFPAVIISLMMISFNLFGNGLRDALNPSLKGSD